MKLRDRFILLLTVIFIGFMLVVWLLSAQLMDRLNQQWGEQFAERQMLADKYRTLSPLIREIAIARQMASNPDIVAFALHEQDQDARARGIAAMERYRASFRDHSYFAAFDKSGNYYFNDAANQYADHQLRYTLSPANDNDRWFYATLRAGKDYQVNVDPDVHLNVTKVWINVLIKNGKQTLGLVGTGIDLSDFLKETVNISQRGVHNLFIDRSLAIQLHNDPKLIDYMTVAKEVGQRIKVDTLLKNPADVERLRQVMQDMESAPNKNATLWVTFNGEKHLLGVSYLPEVGWYDLTLMDQHSLDLIQDMWVAPLLFVLAFLIALLAMALALRRWILHPLAELQSSAHKIDAGNFDIAAPLPGYGEITDLSTSFARMAESVQSSNLELEKKVHDRTEALESANNQLAQDIAERKRIEADLRASNEKLNSLYELSPIGIALTDMQGRYIEFNEAFRRICDYTRDELNGLDYWALTPKEYAEQEALQLESLNRRGSYGPYEKEYIRKDGRRIPLRLNGALVTGSDGQQYIWSTVEDITDRKRTEEVMYRLAHYDALTSLPNRTLFLDRLGQDIKKSNRSGHALALLYIDLDQFKEVNDTLGHHVGDALLLDAARRITTCVRDSDTVARLGGDEFTVILPDLVDAVADSRIERVTQALIHALTEPFHIGGETIHISASIGITVYPADADGAESLLKNADQAMYAAKNGGRNRFSYFTHTLQEKALAKSQLLRDLRNALAAGQFGVHFQPIVDLATGRIFKAEALIRWLHPERGMVSPAEFIPLAEESGLINEIGDWVFRESARWVKRWNARCPEGLNFNVSVNKSPVQFISGIFQDDWLHYLKELDLPGQCITIEITEGLLLNANAGVTDTLLRFRDAGIQVSIDDFGTGYSALSYLKKFDIDYLKIDQSFVRNLETDASDLALAEAIIVMGHKLGLKVIAEGVETGAQREILLRAGCDYAQGHFFSPPIPPEEFDQLLEQNQRLQP
jgi:diguanylate cyclase (GGDEF)-like protein/PAS domain S-box-containing protein